MNERADVDEVLNWLRASAVQLEDLTFFKEVFNGVRVIGLGEATHGTREFFELRHNLLRYLVTELGFCHLALEASYSATMALNDYVLNGNGDRSDVISQLGFVMWDVQEFAAIIDWLRSYNKSATPTHQVRVHGIDVCNTRGGRQAVLDYLREAAPDKFPDAERIFKQVALAEAKGQLAASEVLDEEIGVGLQNLTDFCICARPRLTACRPVDEYLRALEHLDVIRRWVDINFADERLPSGSRRKAVNNFSRSKYMAELLLRLLEGETSGAKVAVWAHNFHVCNGYHIATDNVIATMGSHLKAALGEQYYALGLELNRGTYLARAYAREEKALGDFVIGTVPKAPDDSLPWHLARTGKDAFFLNLRGSTRSTVVEEWLTRTRTMHLISWAQPREPSLYTQVNLKEGYDGVIFVDRTSPTTPTLGAQKTVAERAGH